MDRNGIFKIVVLIFIFIATIFVVNRINNKGVTDLAAEMEQAKLPILYVRKDDRLINMLHGYTGKVDTTYFRDTITPLDTKKTITLWVAQARESIDGYVYELRSMYQGGLLEEDEIRSTISQNGYMQLEITFRTDMEEKQEYVLVIKAKEGEDVLVRYYTRIVIEDKYHASELIDFVLKFNDSLFDKNEAEEMIIKSIEPNEKGNNEYLFNIDFHSSFETITFAKLRPVRLTKPILSIKEIDESYAVMQIKYIMTADSENELECYYIVEDYRIRWVDKDTIYLLNYDRTQESMFTPSNVSIPNNWFKLGIVDVDDFQYVTADHEGKVAFVQGRQLWYYNYSAGTITNVFGFCQNNNYIDTRVTYDQHNIRIMDLQDSGDMIFAVYGYMNRGTHEGQVGISVYQFTAGNDKITEILFIENNKPYDVLKADLEKLLYLNQDNVFFYFDRDRIMKLDANQLKSEVVVSNVLNENVAVCAKGNLIGYPNHILSKETTEITILNLDTGKSTLLKGDAEQRLNAIGFVEEDLICGVIRQADIVVEQDNTVICPISTINIIGSNNEIVKTYGKTGVYIVDAVARDGVVYLDRAYKVNGKFQETTQDFITFKEDDVSTRVSLLYRYTDDGYNQLFMIFPDYMYIVNKLKLMITRENINEEDPLVKPDFENVHPKFYVYGQGRYENNFLNLSNAVSAAYQNAGVVIDENGVIVWRKISILEYFTVASGVNPYYVNQKEDTLAACIYMMAGYEGIHADMATIKMALADETKAVSDVIMETIGKQGTDITGCEFENGLYYLCKQTPFIAKLPDNTYVLITSFNEERIRYIDATGGEDVVESRADFEKKTEEAGNVFYSYVR